MRQPHRYYEKSDNPKDKWIKDFSTEGEVWMANKHKKDAYPLLKIKENAG